MTGDDLEIVWFEKYKTVARAVHIRTNVSIFGPMPFDLDEIIKKMEAAIEAAKPRLGHLSPE